MFDHDPAFTVADMMADDHEWFDANFPGWEDREKGEDARFVDYSDVLDPDLGVVVNMTYYMPGADGL